jgi:YD repeat-containing protein
LSRRLSVDAPNTTDASGAALANITHTSYPPQRGLLTRKEYADQKGTDYTYTPGGQLKTRTWQRGIVTTYTYDPTTLAIDTETISYDLDHDGTPDFPRVLDRKPTDLGRDKGWELKDGTTVENQDAYGYSATTGRLTEISNPQISTTLFTYGYEPNSNLIATANYTANALNQYSYLSINNQPSTLNFFPTCDGNGNVSEYLTEAGVVAAHFEYDPFGNTVVNTDTSNLFAYRFSTKPQDSETSLYCYGCRYYDPAAGRWSSRD